MRPSVLAELNDSTGDLPTVDSSTPPRTGLFGTATDALPPVDVAADNPHLVATGNVTPVEADKFPPVETAVDNLPLVAQANAEQSSTTLAHWAGLPATPLPFRKLVVIDDRNMQRICKWDLAKQGKYCPTGCRAPSTSVQSTRGTSPAMRVSLALMVNTPSSIPRTAILSGCRSTRCRTGHIGKCSRYSFFTSAFP
ncbi:hypothetical protein TI39_contig313g00001 [Zymoseptoria brevis]|uniref:Uncharacterized protein n=1 Tax=Zymoseptoria brevis TaxID=1047168 RepID=A0A0F4GX26_9PEZI|nr:hypothetical protein TI39_contig313g00001 [Zymoseptoria brevis]